MDCCKYFTIILLFDDPHTSEKNRKKEKKSIPDSYLLENMIIECTTYLFNQNACEMSKDHEKDTMWLSSNISSHVWGNPDEFLPGEMCLFMGNLFMLSGFCHVQLFVTLWTVACQASLSMGFSRQEYWSRSPDPPPGDLPNPRIEPVFPTSPALQADSSPLRHWGSPWGILTI